jgi:hypothetical protein
MNSQFRWFTIYDVRNGWTFGLHVFLPVLLFFFFVVFALRGLVFLVRHPSHIPLPQPIFIAMVLLYGIAAGVSCVSVISEYRRGPTSTRGASQRCRALSRIGIGSARVEQTQLIFVSIISGLFHLTDVHPIAFPKMEKR